MLAVVVNPVCGACRGKQLAQDHVLPLLASHGRHPDLYAETECPGHAGTLLINWITQTAPTPPLHISIILISGDGTLHEIVNALYRRTHDDPSFSLPQIRFVLVAAGTANALYASLCLADGASDPLASLRTFLSSAIDSSPVLVPLTLARTTFHPPSDTPVLVPKPIIAAVVTSTSLHASILQDSEALRSTIPGLERFKTAAAQNATRWYSSRVRLLPSSDADEKRPQIYDANTDSFVPYTSKEGEDGTIELDGPFVYFLSTVNVDRLEPQFQIAPLARSHKPAGGTMDLIVVRPMRDPSIGANDEEARCNFGTKTWKVLGAAYDGGRHVVMRYGGDGAIDASNAGVNVVEYLRIGGWEWIPVRRLAIELAISFADKNDRMMQIPKHALYALMGLLSRYHEGEQPGVLCWKGRLMGWT
ncbi:hypothetical protein EVG20_g637 [Dentipellis fragilis]|uniref:DAGKc domain-containing protein n=1 Tax=Dentipellis fragilis TaxID=205917 RepID=A0A4Y9ZF55_9AGAM|nr:hypothetical protein EVG20_g637 [Dentipellis fragilis]